MIAILAHGEPAATEPLPLWIWLAAGALMGEAINAASHDRDPAPSRYVLAGSLGLSAALHVGVTPSHFDESLHLGLFFAVSSFVLAWLTVRVLTHDTPVVHSCAFAVTLGLIVLYVAAREFSLPLVEGADYSLLGNVSKGFEALAATLAAAAAQPRLTSPPASARRSLRGSSSDAPPPLLMWYETDGPAG